MKEKELYLEPACLVVKVRTVSIICLSNEENENTTWVNGEYD